MQYNMSCNQQSAKPTLPLINSGLYRVEENKERGTSTNAEKVRSVTLLVCVTYVLRAISLHPFPPSPF